LSVPFPILWAPTTISSLSWTTSWGNLCSCRLSLSESRSLCCRGLAREHWWASFLYRFSYPE
jgi:hypothetical protein